MTFRVKFKKGYEVKYISHLDLLRTVNRMLKRSGLSLKYSEGFNPHTILTFALPLSVGMTSNTEILEVSFTKEYSSLEVKNALKAVEPLGIEILEVTDNLSPKIKELTMAEYNVLMDCNRTTDDILKILNSEEIIIDKKTKKGIKAVDIKPLIVEFEVENKEELIQLKLKVLAGSTSNLNPDLLIKAFQKYDDQLEIKYYAVERLSLISSDNIKY